MKIIVSLFLYFLINNSYCATFQDGLAAAINKKYSEAYLIFLPLAEQGDVKSQSFLATLYYNGYGITENYNEAIKWYTLAAKKGDRYAINSLKKINGSNLKNNESTNDPLNIR
jgi:TPR repeat protein